jgi:hypothetical protein
MFNYFRNASATGKIIPRIFTTEQYKKTLCRLIQQQQNLPLFTFEFICTYKLFVVYEHFHTYIHTRSHTLTHTYTHAEEDRDRKRNVKKWKFFVMFSTSVFLSKTMVAWCHHRVFNCSYTFDFICLLPKTVVVLCVSLFCQSLWLLIVQIVFLVVITSHRLSDFTCSTFILSR